MAHLWIASQSPTNKYKYGRIREDGTAWCRIGVLMGTGADDDDGDGDEKTKKKQCQRH